MDYLCIFEDVLIDKFTNCNQMVISRNGARIAMCFNNEYKLYIFKLAKQKLIELNRIEVLSDIKKIQFSSDDKIIMYRCKDTIHTIEGDYKNDYLIKSNDAFVSGNAVIITMENFIIRYCETTIQYKKNFQFNNIDVSDKFIVSELKGIISIHTAYNFQFIKKYNIGNYISCLSIYDTDFIAISTDGQIYYINDEDILTKQTLIGYNDKTNYEIYRSGNYFVLYSKSMENIILYVFYKGRWRCKKTNIVCDLGSSASISSNGTKIITCNKMRALLYYII